MERKNCWEVKKCGRQPGGENIKELGICAATLPNEYDDINKGKNGGRFCWAITGTLCNGEVQGIYAKKLKDCLVCEFLNQAHKEEERLFILTTRDAKNILK